MNVARLQTMIRDADKARAEEIAILNPLPPFEEITHPWPLYWRAYRKGDFWSSMTTMPAWKSRPATNIPFQTVQTNTTLLTDSRPVAVPVADSGHMDDYYLAEALKAAYLQWFNTVAGDLQVTLGVQTSRIFGLGWWRLDADSDGQEWTCIHPDSVRVSPDTTVESFIAGNEPNYLVYEYETTIGKLKKAFPRDGFKKRIDWTDFRSEWTVQSDYERVRPDDQTARSYPFKKVKVYQVWMKDDSEVEWKDTIGDSVVTKAKDKYPGGRVVTVSGGIILDDRSNPYEHGQYPFTPIFAYLAPGQFYPIGDIQNILPLTYLRNRMVQLYFDQAAKTGGGKLFLGRASGLTTADITNAPFEVLECNDVSAIRYDSYNAPRRDLLELINSIDRDIDNTAGIHDISRGARTPGNPVTAQEAAMLGESDRTRIRLAARLLTWSLNRHARQWCSNAVQFDKNEYVLKVAADPNEERPGMEGVPQVPVTFSFADLKVGDKVRDGLHYGIKFTEFSSLPMSINEDKNMAFGLFDRGLIDEEDLLLALDYPNARHVAQKARERKSQATQAQAQPPMPDAAPPQEVAEAGPPQMEGMPPEVEQMVNELVAQGLAPEEAIQVVQEAMNQAGVA